MLRMRTSVWSLLLFPVWIFGCAESNSAAVPDNQPLPGAWASVALTVAGPAANNDKRRTCAAEARRAGIELSPTAQLQATIFLSDQGNYVTTPRGNRQLGMWTTDAVCRVALGVITDLDERVQVGRGDPPGCRILGSVQGDDRGFAIFFSVVPGSYEAAQTGAQLAALQLGGNFVVIDVVRQIGLSVAVNGRALACGGPPPPPPQQSAPVAPGPPQTAPKLPASPAPAAPKSSPR